MSDDDSNGNRPVSGKRRPEDQDPGLRPQYLREIIGQERVIEQLQILVDAAKGRKEPLNHILFYGPPGLGKTTLSHVIAKEMGGNIRITAGAPPRRPADLPAVLPPTRVGPGLVIYENSPAGQALRTKQFTAARRLFIAIFL